MTVREVLLDDHSFRELLGRSATTLRVRKINRVGATSERYQLRWDGQAQHVAFAKRYPAAATASVEREHDALVCIRRVAGRAINAPRPLLVLPEHRLIVLEWVEAKPISMRLFRDSITRPSRYASRAATLAGLAAEALHVLRSIRIEPADHVESTLRRYRLDSERRLARLERIHLPRPLMDRIRTEVQPILDTIHPVDLSFQHSDFGPWNLLVDRAGCLWVTDLHNAAVGHRSYDEAFFSTALDLFFRYRVVRVRPVVQAQQAFEQRLGGDDRSAQASEPERLQTLARFSLLHMAYFGAGLAVNVRHRELLWLPRPLEPFLRKWFERRLATLG